MNKIIEFVEEWQKNNDKDFKTLPIDEHSKLIFNFGNRIYEFIFSNNCLRDKCKEELSNDIISEFTYIVDQEDGFTFYKI